jgi:hypothetical protein
MNSEQPILLVGDNPFHGISHLSQQSVEERGTDITRAKFAAEIVKISVENGANGFMFSVSETTLSILQTLPEKELKDRLDLYALVPYAYEYVRLATHEGGLPGLAKRFAKEVLQSGNLKTVGVGLKGILTSNPIDIMKAYLSYEIIRIKSSSKNRGTLRSVLLHEVITDMAIALNLEGLVKAYIKYMNENKIKPGFETRNFSYLVNKFLEWGIDFKGLVLAAPFNKIGFYMNPSKDESEKALSAVSGSTVIAMSILAAGYLKPGEAVDYVRGLSNTNALVVGVSNEKQARETFKLLAT